MKEKNKKGWKLPEKRILSLFVSKINNMAKATITIRSAITARALEWGSERFIIFLFNNQR